MNCWIRICLQQTLGSWSGKWGSTLRRWSPCWLAGLGLSFIVSHSWWCWAWVGKTLDYKISFETHFAWSCVKGSQESGGTRVIKSCFIAYVLSSLECPRMDVVCRASFGFAGLGCSQWGKVVWRWTLRRKFSALCLLDTIHHRVYHYRYGQNYWHPPVLSDSILPLIHSLIGHIFWNFSKF